MTGRNRIKFLRRGEVVELAQLAPMRTLLDYLRLGEASRGTKEGCGEGDCGACTVSLGSLKDGRLVYEPVNACILLLGQVDGKDVVTVDDLSRGGKLHPIQQAMVETHGSQCGFCTPGFVMSLFALYQSDVAADRQTVVDQVAGNLCRCTGYRPIIEAALAACTGSPDDAWSRARAETAQALARLDDGSDIFIGDETAFFAAPASDAALAQLTAQHPDAVLLAGATDVGLWITKQLRDIGKIIHLGRLSSLRRVEDTIDAVRLGAAVTYAEAERALGDIDPDLTELLRRLGSKQVRASGTIGGNIANGSPIGDTPPALIALGAELELRKGATMRRIALEDFFIAYGKQDRAPDEIVASVSIPRLRRDEAFRCYKITKRFDQDISSVLGAFKFTIAARRVTGARIAYGGMAATPKRALKTETAAHSLSLDDPAGWEAAADCLAQDFQPIGDHRASAGYRAETARALFIKALTEISGMPTRATRVTGFRELVDAG
ncbi:xanthine dehydrogenase small subunit [Nordella sp. HKS 07]|uniref:xanthine dehydrogenase small subunit n=1 Tax=Nordella sp. HKS 07 TaxID=2712222 RepID=UPI0013E121F0|nr:xanthine dehydrogenase small subunit [Nordella sp. HKS 07]QIG49675.1 xanthine dehydrogenase small subunit [Nordella sp. HKS 07]